MTPEDCLRVALSDLSSDRRALYSAKKHLDRHGGMGITSQILADAMANICEVQACAAVVLDAEMEVVI